MAGGGITGVMRALREAGGELARSLIVVGRELTPETRAGLIDGVIKVILSMDRGVIPPHLHLRQPNPLIS